MSISQAVYLNLTSSSSADKTLPRRWVLVIALLVPLLVMLVFILRQSDPLSDLEAAKVRWAATNITDYRIVVDYKRPYLSCQQDFEVRGVDISYKHKDSCGFGGAVTRPNANWPTVANLFARIEDAQKNPQCGPNGCICDGPLELSASYDSERGYPVQMTYTLRQDLRTRDLQYWLALLDGSLAKCPQVTYIGQTISVTSLEMIAPLVDQLSEATSEISIGNAIKPEATPAN